MTFEYGISLRNADMLTFTRMTASQIIAKLDRSVPLQLAHIRAVEELVRNGCRYSNEDGDVLSAAYCVVREARTEVREWEAGWVARMAA